MCKHWKFDVCVLTLNLFIVPQTCFSFIKSFIKTYLGIIKWCLVIVSVSLFIEKIRKKYCGCWLCSQKGNEEDASSSFPFWESKHYQFTMTHSILLNQAQIKLLLMFWTDLLVDWTSASSGSPAHGSIHQHWRKEWKKWKKWQCHNMWPFDININTTITTSTTTTTSATTLTTTWRFHSLQYQPTIMVHIIFFHLSFIVLTTLITITDATYKDPAGHGAMMRKSCPNDS